MSEISGLKFWSYWCGPGFQFVHRLGLRSLVACHPGSSVTLFVDDTDMDLPVRELEEDGVACQTLDWSTLAAKATVDVERVRRFVGRTRTNHRSDLFRYLVLLAEGGVYIDVDVLVLRSMASLLNGSKCCAAYQYYARGKNYINGAVLAAPAGAQAMRDLVEAALELETLWHAADRTETGRGESAALPWAAIGPALLTRRLLPTRTTASVARALLAALERLGMANSWLAQFVERACAHSDCGDWYLQPRNAFYGISCFTDEWRRLFRPGSLPPNATVMHLWGNQSASFTATIDDEYIRQSDSVYAQVARAYLPSGLSQQ